VATSLQNNFNPTPMSGECIVCFAKDWGSDPTCVTHIMTQLAKTNRVLWLNSIGTRAPNLASGRDIKRIFRKLRGFFAGARRVQDNLWVYTPLVLPLPHNRLAAALNRWILRTSVKLQRRKLGMDQFQLWTFLPNANQYFGKMGESLSVYYCSDDWSKFKHLNGAEIATAEQDLLRKVDLVFATAQSLVDSRIGVNPETHLARHGVDKEFFATALLPVTAIPPDIASIPQPIIGFFGLLQEWVDLELLEQLAARHPNWSIVLIGSAVVDVSSLKKYPNVHLLGQRSYAQLPGYCKAFSVGLIPFKLNELVRHVNPLKLREYLAAGLPVVSTVLPEVQKYSEFCVAAKTPDEFEQAVAQAIAADSAEMRQKRSASVEPESWRARVADVTSHVMRVANQKAKNRTPSAIDRKK
jgi:glycosyltransferase involved in cell wall biosynthesis